MSRLWLEQAANEWRAIALPPGQLVLIDGLGLLGLRQRAALFARDGAVVRVNGEPVLGGLRLLEHRDELLTPRGRGCFSGESAPVVTRFTRAPGARVPTCPVCRGPVREGMAAVQCPGCGRWAHQLDDRECWTYAPHCRFCNHPTSFAEAAAWRPDREDDRD